MSCVMFLMLIQVPVISLREICERIAVRVRIYPRFTYQANCIIRRLTTRL